MKQYNVDAEQIISMNIVIWGVQIYEGLEVWISDFYYLLSKCKMLCTKIHTMLEVISHHVQELVGAMVC